MTRVLRSATKKLQNRLNSSSNMNISHKSKAIKKRKKSTPEATSEIFQQSYIWNIDPVLYTIFTYSDFKDLVEFNTVCKRWNQLINPIIHRSLKLLRSPYIQNKAHGKSLNKSGKIDAEVGECIADNAKFAHLIKEFKFNQKLSPQRAIEFFETFKFIAYLTIASVEISQDQFLSMIKPLNQLKELKMHYLAIKKITKKSYIKTIQLPQTLTKLTINRVDIIGNPESFIQTINSHNNLKEFIYDTYNENDFLSPFCKHYPSLKVFDYGTRELENVQILLNLFGSNPQLLVLKLQLNTLSDNLIRHIERSLVNLEDLTLLKYPSYRQLDSSKVLNLNKPTNIKKLKLSCEYVSESSLDSILVNCPYLKELDVQLPKTWKILTKLICEKSINLEKLTLWPANQIYGEELLKFFQELYEGKFLTNNSSYKNIVTHLTLNNFNFFDSKEKYFEQFKKLKVNRLPSRLNQNGVSNETNTSIQQWPNYILKKINHKHSIDIELIKL